MLRYPGHLFVAFALLISTLSAAQAAFDHVGAHRATLLVSVLTWWSVHCLREAHSRHGASDRNLCHRVHRRSRIRRNSTLRTLPTQFRSATILRVAAVPLSFQCQRTSRVVRIRQRRPKQTQALAWIRRRRSRMRLRQQSQCLLRRQQTVLRCLLQIRKRSRRRHIKQPAPTPPFKQILAGESR